MKMTNMILCTDLNGGLGYKGQLLYHIPEDLKRFKELTTGNVVLMGRKTFESLGSKPLPKRINLVASSTLDKIINKEFYENEGISTSLIIDNNKCLDEFFVKNKLTKKDVFIIGGQSIYKYYINKVDKVYLTLVLDESKDHDAEFNFKLYEDDFILESSELKFNEENNVWYQFKNYIRK